MSASNLDEIQNKSDEISSGSESEDVNEGIFPITSLKNYLFKLASATFAIIFIVIYFCTKLWL